MYNNSLLTYDWRVLCGALIVRPLAFPACTLEGPQSWKAESQVCSKQSSDIEGNAEGTWVEHQGPLRKVIEPKHGAAGQARPHWKLRASVSRKWNVEESQVERTQVLTFLMGYLSLCYGWGRGVTCPGNMPRHSSLKGTSKTIAFSPCYGLNCVSQNSHAEALTLQCDCVWRQGLWGGNEG